MSSVTIGDRLRAIDGDRRWFLLILALLLVILGVGIGGPPLGEDRGDSPSATLSVSTPTPTPTPTEGGATGPTETAGGDTGPTDGSETQTPVNGPESTPTDEESATPTSTPLVEDTPSDGGGGGGGSGGGSDAEDDRSSVRLEAVGSGARINYANVAPGDSGRDRFVLENVGNGSGRLSMATVTVHDAENGLVGGERRVDDTPDAGELSKHLEVVVEVHGPDGSVRPLYGTGSGARSLADLSGAAGPADGGVLAPGEQAVVVVDWRVPASTGNEIQSDAVAFDLSFGLRSVAD